MVKKEKTQSQPPKIDKSDEVGSMADGLKSDIPDSKNKKNNVLIVGLIVAVLIFCSIMFILIGQVMGRGFQKTDCLRRTENITEQFREGEQIKPDAVYVVLNYMNQTARFNMSEIFADFGKEIC